MSDLSSDKNDEVRLELGHLRAGAIVRFGGMPFRIKTAVEVESHADNFNAVLDDENVSGVTPRLAIGAIPSSTAKFYCAGEGCSTQCDSCRWADEAKPESTPSARLSKWTFDRLITRTVVRDENGDLLFVIEGAKGDAWEARHAEAIRQLESVFGRNASNDIHGGSHGKG